MELKIKPCSWSWGARKGFPHTPNSDGANQPSHIKAWHNLPQGIPVLMTDDQKDISQHKIQMYGIIFFQYYR